MNGLRSKRFLLLGLAFLSVVALNPAAAQSHEVVDAESNLSRSDLTVEFSGLNASSDYELQYESGGEWSSVESFETDGGGAASVEFLHDPFGNDISSLSAPSADKGWNYRAEPLDSNNEDLRFQLKHGNMLMGLDTFNDNSVNDEVWVTDSNDDGDCTSSLNEEDEELQLVASGTDASNFDICGASAEFDNPVDNGAAVKFAMESDSSNDGEISIGVGDIFSESVTTDGYENFEAYISDGTAYLVNEGEIVRNESTTQEEFNMSFDVESDGEQESSANINLESISIVPEVSKNAFNDVNIFDPSETNLLFDEVVSPYASDSGLEYSTDGDEWGSSVPDGLFDQLYYRVVDSDTMWFTATETNQAYQSLEIEDIEPRDNTVFTVPENESFNVDFLYDISYDQESEARVEWTLENESDELTSSVYPGVDTPLDERRFTENYDVEIGQYNWTVIFEDPDVGGNSSETFGFEVIDEDNATVEFDLLSPESGETVEPENGEIPFEYQVDAENSGTVDLYIPEESESEPQFSEDLGSGTTSRTVNLDVPEAEDLSWYLTYTEDDSRDVYTSQSVDFSTGEADPDDGEDEDDGLEISIPDLYFSAMEQFGFGEDAAGYIAGMFLTLIFTAIGYVLAGTVGGSGSFILSITVAAIVGLFPSWVILVTVFTAAGAAAYMTVKVARGE